MRKLPIFLGALVVIVAVVVLSLSPGKVYSANVGDHLTSPESGWTRYETDEYFQWYSYFTFWGNWITLYSAPCSNNYTRYCTNQGNYVSFVMYGDKFRIIGDYYIDRCNNIGVNIDGTDVGTFSEYSTQPQQCSTLCAEYSMTGNGPHTIRITKGNTGSYIDVDAIDIPNDGSLVDPNAPTPSPTPAPAASPDLCYDYSIVGSLGIYNPGTISSNSQSTQVFTVTGVQLGDFVQVSFDQDLQGITLYGYVSAVNQVTVVFQNRTGGNITLTSGNVRVHINRHVKG
jgi:hypothetical protein